MQAEGKLPEGVPKTYPSAIKAYNIIIKFNVVNFKLIIKCKGKKVYQHCGQDWDLILSEIQL